MTRDEIIERLNRYEWSDVEFKEARNAAPRSAYETVSGFANTAGGWLVFGVRDRGGTLEMVGIMHVDKVQNEFLSTLRSRQKINRAIGVAEDAVETDGATLLVFHIPESPRSDKPVYLDGDTSGGHTSGAAPVTSAALPRRLNGSRETLPNTATTVSLSGWMPRSSSTRNPCVGTGECSTNATQGGIRRCPMSSS